MPDGLTDSELEEFLKAARRAASQVSKDPQVIGEAANFAVTTLAMGLERVSPGTRERTAWVKTVARNNARSIGAKAHRDRPMGLGGSLPPPPREDEDADRVELLIREMRDGGAGSLGSLVANRLDFARVWVLISDADRLLLDLKYGQGLSSKEIAAELGRTPGTVDNQLSAAKKAARLLFDDLLGDFDQDVDGD